VPTRVCAPVRARGKSLAVLISAGGSSATTEVDGGTLFDTRAPHQRANHVPRE
jgi:hypothetical protein